MNWWTTAFNHAYAEIFDRLFPEPTDREVEAMVGWFPKDRFPRVLDLACGEGRHSIALSSLGYRVTGVDQSPDFIERAKQFASAAGSNPEFVFDDIRTMNLGRRFDAVLLVGQAFGYGTDEDQKHILANAAQHLDEDGVFLLAMANGLRSMRSLASSTTAETKYDIDGEDVVVRDDYTFDPATCVKRSVWTVFRSGRKIYEQATRVRYYTAPEVVGLLHGAGLEVHGMFGGYDERPYDLDSGMLIVKAKKIRASP